VKILLGRDDVNPDKPDNDGRTPLWRAAYCGHEGVVKILLRRDGIKPDKPDNVSRTPLFMVACCGWERVVKMLLVQGVKSDKPNINGRTPLHLAAWNGLNKVVKILLRQDNANPNELDKGGIPPLARATENGHQEVIALLQPPRTCGPQPVTRTRGHYPPTVFECQ